MAAADSPEPILLLPFQKRWIGDPASVRVMEKARQTGVTWTLEAEAVLTAAPVDGTDVWYSAQDKDQAVEFIRECQDWVKMFGAAAVEVGEMMIEDEDEDILTYYIRFASGKKIHGLSSRPRKFRGKKGLFIIDEAAHHDDLNAMLKAAMATLIWGNRLAIVSTHNGITNPFNELVNDIRSGKRKYSLHRVTFDEAIEQGLCRRVFAVTGKKWSKKAQKQWRDSIVDDYGDDAEEELHCNPKSDAKSYIGRKLIEAAMVGSCKVARLSLSKSFMDKTPSERAEDVDAWLETEVGPLIPGKSMPPRSHLVGMDVGRVTDLSSIAVGVLASDYRLSFALIVELRNCPFQQQREILTFIVNKLGHFDRGHIDATGSGKEIGEWACDQWGSQFEAIDISRKWYASVMPGLRGHFEEGLIRIPRDTHVSEDLQAFQLLDGIPKLPKAKTNRRGQPRHGDSGIAIAMAYDAMGGSPGIAIPDDEESGSVWANQKGAF